MSIYSDFIGATCWTDVLIMFKKQAKSANNRFNNKLGGTCYYS